MVVSSRTAALGAGIVVFVAAAYRIWSDSKYRNESTKHTAKVEISPGKILIKNPEAVREKISSIIDGGPDDLLVISDFDMTLTKFMVDGKRGMSTHGVIEKSSNVLPEEYGVLAKALFEKYYPIEVNPKLSPEEKADMMEEWWNEAHKLLIRYGLKWSDIPRAVTAASVGFREGCTEFFDTLHDLDVSLLIFSAGIGDVLKEILRQREHLYPNMHVISNYIAWDETTQKAVGFLGRTIHVFNKYEFSIAGSEFHRKVEKRRKVILLGDGLGDLQMSHGVAYDTILTIGFLNDKIEERMEAYVNAFDVVILNDGPMDYVNDIVRQLALKAKLKAANQSNEVAH
eukprot:Opistho-2@81989